MLDENCIFCKIIKNEIPSFKFYEDKNFIAILDINPIKEGHTMIIPKEHCPDILDLEEPIHSELFKTAKKIGKILKKTFNSKRIGYAIEGFGVDHVHLHLVPIDKGYELNPCDSKNASKEELKETLEKIKKNIN
ncbi:MAG: HIT family protein [Candidatus ainarchaeum sp.]|nr:HIT family protein [Candidatus ainarchaeum sp.]